MARLFFYPAVQDPHNLTFTHLFSILAQDGEDLISTLGNSWFQNSFILKYVIEIKILRNLSP